MHTSRRVGLLALLVICVVPTVGEVPRTAAQSRCTHAEYESAFHCGVRMVEPAGVPDLLLMSPDVAIYLGHIRLCTLSETRALACIGREPSRGRPLLRILRRLSRLERSDPARYSAVYLRRLRRGHDEYVRSHPDGSREESAPYGP